MSAAAEAFCIRVRPPFTEAAGYPREMKGVTNLGSPIGIPGARYNAMGSLTTGRLLTMARNREGRRWFQLKDRSFFKIGWGAKPS